MYEKDDADILQNNNAILSSDNIIDFLQGSVKKKKKKIARSFNFTFYYTMYIHALSLINSKIG